MLKKKIMNRSIAPAVNNEVQLTKLAVEKSTINGVELNYVNGGSSPLLKLEMVYNAGSKYQDQALVASLAFDLLRDGSKKLNGKAFKEAINGLGVYYGMDISKDFGTFSFYVLEKNLEALLTLVKDLIIAPNLPENEFDRLLQKEKNNFLVDLEKTDFLSRQRFAEVLFAGSEYGRVAHAESFDIIKYDMSVKFIQEFVIEKPFDLFVSGCISDQVKSTLSSFIQKLPITKESAKKIAKDSTPELGEHIIKKDSEQCSLMLGKKMVNKHHKDVHNISITNTLLGGYFGSRLMQNIREDKGWTYGINSTVLTYENAANLVISADVLKDKGPDTLNEIKLEIQKLQTELITVDELEVMKNYLKGKLLKSFDGAFEQVDRFFSVDSFDLDWTFYDDYIYALEKITPEDIQATANQYFKWNEFVIVRAGGAS